MGSGSKKAQEFNQKYNELTGITKQKKEIEKKETAQPLFDSHEGMVDLKYRRELRNEKKVIMGLQQQFTNNIRHVNRVGLEHLAENHFRQKRHYDELDVINFD